MQLSTDFLAIQCSSRFSFGSYQLRIRIFPYQCDGCSWNHAVGMLLKCSACLQCYVSWNGASFCTLHSFSTVMSLQWACINGHGFRRKIGQKHWSFTQETVVTACILLTTQHWVCNCRTHVTELLAAILTSAWTADDTHKHFAAVDLEKHST